MTVLDWIRAGSSMVCFTLGIMIMIVSVIGNYKFHFSLNRMHSAAMGDSLGILLIMAGVMLLAQNWMDAVKALLVVVFFWLAAPVCSHLVAMLEVVTNDDLEKDCEVEEE